MTGDITNRSPACAWCLRYGATTCIFPGGEQCQLERRLEDMAYTINNMMDQL